jgi:N6-adenosine-specific RNA methylase IME4
MTTGATITRYDAARQALAEARSFDEVLDIRDKAEAVRAYARMAKDQQLELDAAEIRIRAIRRIGEMIATQPKATGARQPGTCRGTTRVVDCPASYNELGIDKHLAAEARVVASLSEAQFDQSLALWRERAIAKDERVKINPFRAADKAERRSRRERELADKICALPSRKYGVIYADPPWKFAPWGANGMDRSAANHYPEQEAADIMALDVDRIAYDDCALFLWATVPMLEVGLAVLRAWGFSYRTNFNWTKDQLGLGFWNRNKHEHLLLGVRGKPPAPAQGTQWPSVIEALRTAHSAKPDIFYELIEQYFPTVPKLELYARKSRSGWDAWGNESEQPKSKSVRADDAKPFPTLVMDCCGAELSASRHCGADYVTADGRPARIKAKRAEDLSIPEFLRREPRLESN